MKKHLKLLLSIVLVSVFGCLSGQARMVVLKSGSLEVLKQEK